MGDWQVFNSGAINNTYASGTVSGGDKSICGGLIGSHHGAYLYGGPNAEVASLAGSIDNWYGKIINSYAIGNIVRGSNANIGGLAGDLSNKAGVINAYYNNNAEQTLNNILRSTNKGIGRGLPR